MFGMFVSGRLFIIILLTQNMLFIAANNLPLRHVWFVGDDLLEKTVNALRQLMNQHVFDATKPELYIYKEYHVEAFHDGEVKATYRNIMRKVRNNLTQALNKFPTILPNYVVIIFNNSYIHDHIFVEFELKTILKRVLNDVERLLASRREQLTHKAINLFGQTEVFMMRPLPKPAKSLKGEYNFKNTRRFLNQMLDKLARTYNFKPLNIDEINCAQRALFEDSGDLSDFGMERMWFSISESIKQRDKIREAAMSKATVRKHEVATQTEQGVISFTPEKGWTKVSAAAYDELDSYYTQPTLQERNWQPSEEARRWYPRDGESNRFDDYHRQYDREHYAQDYHANY